MFIKLTNNDPEGSCFIRAGRVAAVVPIMAYRSGMRDEANATLVVYGSTNGEDSSVVVKESADEVMAAIMQVISA
jgi:hypothetical protein